jgi:hypothetical protein
MHPFIFDLCVPLNIKKQFHTADIQSWLYWLVPRIIVPRLQDIRDSTAVGMGCYLEGRRYVCTVLRRSRLCRSHTLR